MYRNTIYWNACPTITNKELRKDMDRQQQLIRNMMLSEEDGDYSTKGNTCIWSQKMTPSILRRKKYNYSVSLKKGQSILLHFSVFQHDVGFMTYFNSTSSDVFHSPLMII